MKRGRAAWPFVVGTVLGASLVFLAVAASLAGPNFPVDDAYISYVYAANLAEGRGLVFQPGERVEGFSNFSWVVLHAAASRCGLSFEVTSRSVSILSVVAILGLLASRPGGGRFGPHHVARVLIVALLALDVPLALNALSGLEAVAYAALLALGVGAVFSGHPRSGILALLAASWTRPEGVVISAVVGAASLVGRGPERRRRIQRWVVWFALPYGAYTLGRVLYFGSPIPNSVLAKSGLPLAVSLDRSLALVSSWAADYRFLLGAVLVALVALPVPARGAGERFVPASALLGLLGLNLYMGHGDNYSLMYRYLTPALPLAGLAILGSWPVVDRDAGRARSWRSTIGGAAVLVLLAMQCWTSAATLRAKVAKVAPDRALPSAVRDLFRADTRPPVTDDPTSSRLLWGLAEWVRTEVEDGSLLATNEIGILGFRGNVRILDAYGLVDPKVARADGLPGDKLDLDDLFARDPDAIAFKIREAERHRVVGFGQRLRSDSRFDLRYDPTAAFTHGTSHLVLFSRREQERFDAVLDLTRLFGEAEVLEGPSVDRDSAREEKPPKGRRNDGLVSVRRARFVTPEERRRFWDREATWRGRDGGLTRSESERLREWLVETRTYLHFVARESPSTAIVRYSLDLPEAPRLSFSVTALPPGRPDASGAMDLVVALDSVGGSSILHEEILRGESGRPPDWEDRVLDLGPWAGRSVVLELRVGRVPGRQALRVAVGSPRIESGPERSSAGRGS